MVGSLAQNTTKEKTMVKPQLCRNEDEIRRVITSHVAELVKTGQQVKAAWRENPVQTYTLRGYEPPAAGGEYADALFLYGGVDTVFVTTPRELTHFEVIGSVAKSRPAVSARRQEVHS